ncbi:hypothetical protein T492DRAFT_1038367 [Pavlovales sp. CCMP2436]|nr:hypothetical protein T492DRAFT_1038367 [Pavlovales sp. CCMP2436]
MPAKRARSLAPTPKATENEPTAANVPPAGAAALPGAALVDFKAHVAKRQVTLDTLLASSSAKGGAQVADAAAGPPPGLKDVLDELARLRAKYGALRTLRETEPERLHTSTLLSAVESANASDALIRTLRAEKDKVLEDMGELTAAVVSMEAIVRERDALAAKNTQLTKQLAALANQSAGAQPAQPECGSAVEAGAAGAGVALRLRMFELLTSLKLTAVTTMDGEPAVVCRGQQRGGDEGAGLNFSLYWDEGTNELEFDLLTNTLRGIPVDSLPAFLRVGAGKAEEEGTAISFDASDSAAFFTQIALALATPPSVSS